MLFTYNQCPYCLVETDNENHFITLQIPSCLSGNVICRDLHLGNWIKCNIRLKLWLISVKADIS